MCPGVSPHVTALAYTTRYLVDHAVVHMLTYSEPEAETEDDDTFFDGYDEGEIKGGDDCVLT